MLGILSSYKQFKNPRKTRIGQTPSTHPPIQFFIFFLETFGNMKTTQETQKKTQLKSELGLEPPTHARVFI